MDDVTLVTKNGEEEYEDKLWNIADKDVTMVTRNGEEEDEDKLLNTTDKDVTVVTKNGEEEDEDKLWNITDKLVKKFYDLGKECIFLAVDEDSLQYCCTKIGNRFLASKPKWTEDFRDFCVNLYSSDLQSIQENDTTKQEVDYIEISEEEEVTPQVRTSVDKKLTSIRSGRNKRKVKFVSKDNMVQYPLSKEQQSDVAMETNSRRVSNRLKERYAASVKTGKAKTGRFSSKSINNSKRSADMFIVDDGLKSNETLSKKSKKMDCGISKKKDHFQTGSSKGDNNSKESRKMELKVLKIKDNCLTDKECNNESLKGDNEFDTSESLEEAVKDALKSSNKSKARLNEEERFKQLNPDLQELWLYLNKLNFICKLCSKEYDNTIGYYNHIRCHKDVQHCKICDDFIPKELDGMEKHKAEKHGDGLVFRCFKCHQRYKSKLGLKNHFICMHADNVPRFQCQICGTQFGNLTMLTRHKRIHAYENSCFICLQKIDTKEKLKQHMKDCHGYYLCTTCSLYFVDHAVLEEHEQTHLDLSSNTTSLPDIINTNSTSSSENENMLKQSTNELEMTNLDKDISCSFVKNTQKNLLGEQITAEKVEKPDIDADLEMAETKDETFETTTSSGNKNDQISTTEGEIKKSTESGENQISTTTEGNQISTKPGGKQCKFCGKIFKQRHALLRHMKLHNNKSGFSCEHCGKISKTDETFKRHMKLHLPNDEKPFICHLCGKGFPTRTNLNIHAIVHNEENTYICEYCGQGFRSPRQLKIHNRRHTGEEPYQCTDCNKRFRSWDMLDCHKITHKPKSVICDICGKFFAHRLRLRAHKKSHDTVGKYICIFDELRFKSAGNLNSHYVAKHLDYAKQRGWLLHHCEHCNKVLPSKEKYHRHIRTHTGEKPFKCKICGKSFAENGNLTAHMKIHTNDKPHKCMFCNKCFIQRRTLKKHILIHEQLTDSYQEKCNEDGTGYTKDQLLALSIVAGSQNYLMGTGNDIPVTEKKSVQTADNHYVVIFPESHVFHQVPEQNVERTPLLPVRLSDEASVSPGQVPTSSVCFEEQDYMAIRGQSEQVNSGQYIQSDSIPLGHQLKRISIKPVQHGQKIGHIAEQQTRTNDQIYIDPMCYTEHTVTSSAY